MMEAQRTKEWFIARLGIFTGSRVGDLFKAPKGKEKGLFGDTAMNYIYEIAAERDLIPAYKEDDSLWDIYQNQISKSSKAMDWGTEQEPIAREIYEERTKRRMVETGSSKIKGLPFASSPDGFYYDENTGDKGCLEIKVPSQYIFMKYKHLIKDNDSLLKVEPKYFYQCQSHMLCLGANWCDFTVFNPFCKNSIHIVRIMPEIEAQNEIIERVKEADKIVKQILKQKEDYYK